MIEKLIEELKEIENVEIIMLGGSRSNGKEDEFSDYDIYVYSKGNIPLNVREKFLSKYFKYFEISNYFWEEEDDGILKEGKETEIIYRDISFIEEKLKDALVYHNKNYGYSTCFVYNILNSVVIYDKYNKMGEYKKTYNNYPKELQNKIVQENIQLIYDKMPSLCYQIIKAVKRGDLISINHRVSNYFEIYFDILFALNELFHPGEKRLLEYIKNLEIKPENLEENISEILTSIYTNPKKSIELLVLISNQLNSLVKKEKYNFVESDYKNLK